MTLKVFEFECPECYAIEDGLTPNAEIYCGCTLLQHQMRRRYSLGGAHFKGAGFYRNDKNGASSENRSS